MRLHLDKTLDLTESRIGHSVSENFLVVNALGQHPKQPNRPGLLYAAGEDRRGAKHENVKRIAILCNSLGQEAIVAGKMNWKVQDPVQHEDIEIWVVLVLIDAVLRNFDDGRKNSGALSPMGSSR